MHFQFEAIKVTKERLPNNKSLIGFVGGPWTLSKYAFGNNNSNLIDTKKNLEFISTILIPLLKKNIQLQLDYKRKKSHFTIKNDFTKKTVLKYVKNILKEI